MHITIQFLLRAPIPVYALLNENGLDSRIPEYDSRSKEAVYNSEKHLHYFTISIYPSFQ